MQDLSSTLQALPLCNTNRGPLPPHLWLVFAARSAGGGMYVKQIQKKLQAPLRPVGKFELGYLFAFV